jgi:hypothetical protein
MTASSEPPPSLIYVPVSKVFLPLTHATHVREGAGQVLEGVNASDSSPTRRRGDSRNTRSAG